MVHCLVFSWLLIHTTRQRASGEKLIIKEFQCEPQRLSLTEKDLCSLLSAPALHSSGDKSIMTSFVCLLHTAFWKGHCFIAVMKRKSRNSLQLPRPWILWLLNPLFACPTINHLSYSNQQQPHKMKMSSDTRLILYCSGFSFTNLEDVCVWVQLGSPVSLLLVFLLLYVYEVDSESSSISVHQWTILDEFNQRTTWKHINMLYCDSFTDSSNQLFTQLWQWYSGMGMNVVSPRNSYLTVYLTFHTTYMWHKNGFIVFQWQVENHCFSILRRCRLWTGVKSQR